MTFTESQQNLIIQALVLAADKYVGIAVDAISMAGGERLQQQFLRQAEETRYFAMLIEDGEDVTIGGDQFSRHGVIGKLKAEAASITNQQFADTINERLAKKEVA